MAPTNQISKCRAIYRRESVKVYKALVAAPTINRPYSYHKHRIMRNIPTKTCTYSGGPESYTVIETSKSRAANKIGLRLSGALLAPKPLHYAKTRLNKPE
ncbi:hypothetical protein RRG08_008186 [Elysia crispata]|uniref:Uncharacterized protein n=1 Tax=Elysia crispata TaxID=231223 RepID=A0AAE1DTZ5_9GAST|nr:hypothetical protein RRG08_008186 [Elysia crispata]